MPINYRKIVASERKFNKKYGIDFDIVAFDEKIKLFEDMTGDIDLDYMYRWEFSEIYKKAFTSFIDGQVERKDGYISVTEMLKDFEDYIMADYRAERISNGKPAPKLYGNKKVSDHIKTAQNFLDSIAEYPDEYAKNRYRDGKLSLRKIKSYSEKIMKSNDTSIEKLQILNDYRFALVNANSKRSLLWKFLHLSQCISENNYSHKLMNYISKACGGDGTALSLDGNDMWRKVCRADDSGAIVDFKDSLTLELDKTLWSEKIEFYKNTQRENVKINELERSNDQKIQNVERVFEKQPSLDASFEKSVSIN